MRTCSAWQRKIVSYKKNHFDFDGQNSGFELCEKSWVLFPLINHYVLCINLYVVLFQYFF